MCMTKRDHTQAALIGTSQRQDVMDLLEKRIRSRFSHRRLLLGEPCIGHAPAGAAGQRLPPPQHVSKALCIVQSDD